MTGFVSIWIVGFLVFHYSFFFVDFVDIVDFVDFGVKQFSFLFVNFVVNPAPRVAV